MRTLVAAAVVALATSAPAQAQTRPEIVRGLCQKDGCAEFSVIAVERLRTDVEGTLLRTRLRTYHASSQGRTELGEEAGYVFCSPTTPMVLSESNGKVAGLQIATTPIQESRETIRQQANFYATYFTLCHGPDAGRTAVRDLQGVAEQFGYRFPLGKSMTVAFAYPEEVFSTSAQRAERTEERSQPRSMQGHADDMLPPRPIPAPREQAVRERHQEYVQGGAIPNEESVVERPRSSPQLSPWYREPQRWIESINPF